MSVALITGAGQGIGRAIAIAFSMRDTHVVVADMNGPSASKVKQEIQECWENSFSDRGGCIVGTISNTDDQAHPRRIWDNRCPG